MATGSNKKILQNGSGLGEQLLQQFSGVVKTGTSKGTSTVTFGDHVHLVHGATVGKRIESKGRSPETATNNLLRIAVGHLGRGQALVGFGPFGPEKRDVKTVEEAEKNGGTIVTLQDQALKVK